MINPKTRAEIERIIREQLRTQAAFPFYGAGRNKTGRVPCVSVQCSSANSANSWTNLTAPGWSHQNTGNYVPCAFDTEDYDTDNCWSFASPTSIIIRNPGRYRFTGYNGWTNNGTGHRGLRIRRTRAGTTSTMKGESLMLAHTSTTNTVWITVSLECLAGDVYVLEGVQTSGGNLLLNVPPFFQVELVGNI